MTSVLGHSNKLITYLLNIVMSYITYEFVAMTEVLSYKIEVGSTCSSSKSERSKPNNIACDIFSFCS